MAKYRMSNMTTPDWVLKGFADPNAVSLWKLSLRNFSEIDLNIALTVTKVATVRSLKCMTGYGFAGFMVCPTGSPKIAFLAFSMDAKYDNDPGYCLYWGPVASSMTLSQLIASEDPESKFLNGNKYVSYSDPDAFEAGLNWEVEEVIKELSH